MVKSKFFYNIKSFNRFIKKLNSLGLSYDINYYVSSFWDDVHNKFVSCIKVTYDD